MGKELAFADNTSVTIGDVSRIKISYYTGNGSSYASDNNPKTVDVGFEIKIVCIFGNTYRINASGEYVGCAMPGSDQLMYANTLPNSPVTALTVSGTKFIAYYYLNTTDRYHYIAFG